MHRKVDFLFCDRCMSNIVEQPTWAGVCCPVHWFWRFYELLRLWPEPYREVHLLWPASAYVKHYEDVPVDELIDIVYKRWQLKD
jgi:hypothetical protein